MISIVIRNKNEAKALEDTLVILTKLYKDDFEEIIVVDNQSTDNSVEVAQKYHCKIVNISNFSYGKATNLGIEAAKSQYVLLLSSHAIPVGNSFFKNTIKELKKSNTIAGIRYINSFENYKRAFQNNFEVIQPLKNGLMTACALINKEIWINHKFNEDLVASEDKEWSQRIVVNGFKILDFNESYFYFINRNNNTSLKRYKIETIAYYQLNNKKSSTKFRVILSFIKKIFFINTINYFKGIKNDFKILLIKFEINNIINKDGKNK